MIFAAKPDLTVLALRDSDRVAEAVRAALRDASDAERPGLERAAALIAEVATASDAEVRGRWVLEQFAAAGYDGPVDSVRAVKVLRQAEPSLTLAAAVRLTKDAAAVTGG
ncbi:hypothetical protein [Streptomyces sp. VRA16 Mangrove soil]|uniref:hypothetical protein n=1 Tax=Streptomyces sp. VRA16 Mangrove soil TaxID=2817434 RepID=UPI001A9F8CB6|nr:hypothetical protein [Streptomyces sp. VRA16 Mangrove soil]MBO1335151.1 hypothetical protein [Streptomyces sp. VRA16 Mangrove soil]